MPCWYARLLRGRHHQSFWCIIPSLSSSTTSDKLPRKKKFPKIHSVTKGENPLLLPAMICVGDCNNNCQLEWWLFLPQHPPVTIIRSNTKCTFVSTSPLTFIGYHFHRGCKVMVEGTFLARASLSICPRRERGKTIPKHTESRSRGS